MVSEARPAVQGKQSCLSIRPKPVNLVEEFETHYPYKTALSSLQSASSLALTDKFGFKSSHITIPVFAIVYEMQTSSAKCGSAALFDNKRMIS